MAQHVIEQCEHGLIYVQCRCPGGTPTIVSCEKITHHDDKLEELKRIETEKNEWWYEQGYPFGRQLDDGRWICVVEMIFTWRVMICTPDSVEYFVCYPKENYHLAFEAFLTWNGEGQAPGGYTRDSRDHGGGA